jgi:hypothetical protein
VSRGQSEGCGLGEGALSVPGRVAGLSAGGEVSAEQLLPERQVSLSP